MKLNQQQKNIVIFAICLTIFIFLFPPNYYRNETSFYFILFMKGKVQVIVWIIEFLVLYIIISALLWLNNDEIKDEDK